MINTKSAIKLLTGVNNNIDAINLNEELTHNDYTLMLQEYVANNKEGREFRNLSFTVFAVAEDGTVGIRIPMMDFCQQNHNSKL